jgi:hypothetical protein
MGMGMWLLVPSALELFIIQKKNQSHKNNSFLIIEVLGQAQTLAPFFYCRVDPVVDFRLTKVNLSLRDSRKFTTGLTRELI